MVCLIILLFSALYRAFGEGGRETAAAGERVVAERCRELLGPCGSPPPGAGPQVPSPSRIAGLRLPSFSFWEASGTPRPSKGTRHGWRHLRAGSPELCGAARAAARAGPSLPAALLPAPAVSRCSGGRAAPGGAAAWARVSAGTQAAERWAGVQGSPGIHAPGYLMRLQLFGFPHPRDGALPGAADAGSQRSPTFDSHKGEVELWKLHVISAVYTDRPLIDALCSLVKFVQHGKKKNHFALSVSLFPLSAWEMTWEMHLQCLFGGI